MRHNPVLLQEVVAAFEGCRLIRFVDGTLGAGGHARALFEAHPEMEQYFGFDRDPMTLQETSCELKELMGQKFIPIGANFSSMKEELFDRGVEKVDGILLDLGVSSMQLDQGERGFSFSSDGPLDMRMDTESSLTASKVVNTYPEKDLERIFEEYGELKNGRKLAKALIERRRKSPFNSTFDLKEALMPLLTYRKGKIHPLTLVFQALRIEVNGELKAIEEALPKAIELLSEGGKIAVISFHSLEDRIVKQAFCYYQGRSSFAKKSDPSYALLACATKKPIVPTQAQMRENPRCRSAKLRIGQKK